MSDQRLAEAQKALARYEDRNSKPNPAHLADALRGMITLVTEPAPDYQSVMDAWIDDLRSRWPIEEPQREYTYKSPNGFDDDFAGLPSSNLEDALDMARRFPHEGDVLVRRPASPWVLVFTRGENDE